MGKEEEENIVLPGLRRVRTLRQEVGHVDPPSNLPWDLRKVLSSVLGLSFLHLTAKALTQMIQAPSGPNCRVAWGTVRL